MNEPNVTPNSPPVDPPVDPTNPTPEPNPDPNDPPKPLIEGEPKPGEQAPAEEFVPLTADDITFPDGFTVDEPLRDEFLTIVNDQELSHKDRAQALNGLYVKAAQAASEASSNAWADMQKTWQDEVKADPVVGGDKLTTTLASVNKLVSEYGSPELLEVLNITGAGNSLPVIKFLNNVAGKLTEGGPVSGQPTNQESTAAERLFPSMKGK